MHKIKTGVEMIVMKFGGSSVGTAERIKQVAEIIGQRQAQNPVIVVSAIGGVTDMLIDNAKSALDGSYNIDKIRQKHSDILKGLNLDAGLVDEELSEIDVIYRGLSVLKDLTPRTLDLIQSFGERMSCRIVAAYLNTIGISAEARNAYDVGMLTDDNFGGAEPLEQAYTRLKQNLANTNNVSIVTGFIGKNKHGEITTLGRGGSDYTAAIVGAAIGAEEIQIWTDVDGIMTSDPRVIKTASSIRQVSFDEASELAYFGAKVLHPKTIIPAVQNNIPVRVLNTYNPSHEGTLIVKEAMEKCVKAIAFKRSIDLVSIHSTRMLMAYGFLARIFRVFEKYKIIVDMIATTEVSVSLTVDNNCSSSSLKQAVDEITEFADVKVEKDRAIVSIVGEGIGRSSKILGNVFNLVSENMIDVEMISQGASDINLSFIVNSADVDRTVEMLHQHFFGGRE